MAQIASRTGRPLGEVLAIYNVATTALRLACLAALVWAVAADRRADGGP